jgi:hypothetical protein
MATWSEVHNHITSNYSVFDAKEDIVTINANFDDGRNQRIIIQSIGQLGDSSWARIMTGVAEENQIDLMDLLRRNADMKVGGLAMFDSGDVLFTYAVRIDDLDLGEIDDPIRIVAATGDILEQELTGQDVY